MQLIHDTYAKQLVDLCEIETQQLWRRDHLVDTEYQVLDTLLEWMASLPLDRLTLLTAKFGSSIPEDYAECLVHEIIQYGEPKYADMSDNEWLGELQSEYYVDHMCATFDDLFTDLWDEE